MRALGLLKKIRSFLRKSAVQDIDHGGWIDTTAPLNFWQTGYTSRGGKNEVVYACVQAYSRTIAQLPAKHFRRSTEGFDDELSDSVLLRVMHKPNRYQTRSDFLLNLVASLLYEGNAYVLAARDGNFQIESLHLVPPHSCSPHFVDGDIYYSVAPDQVSSIPAMVVPARDVGHVRLYTPHHPLQGETPLYAASLAVKVNNNIMGHQSKFFENMSRPSGVIETEEKLTPEQIVDLRKKWEDQSKGLNSGRVPILAWGFKWKPLSLNSVDAQLIEAHKMSVERIAAVYGVPLPLVGVLDSATYNNIFNLMSFWKSSGLGFVLEHIEQAISALFGLPQRERLELDTDRLFRIDEQSQMDALTKGVTGGVYAPNEARRKKGLRPVENGDMPRVQQQMVPLNFTPPAPQQAIERDRKTQSRKEMRAALRNAFYGT